MKEEKEKKEEEKQEPSSRKEIGCFKSRKTNIKLTIFSYIGPMYKELRDNGSKDNIEEFNSRVRALNAIREPEEMMPLIEDEHLSFYIFPVGPCGEYELYYSERSGISKDEIKYRRLYRLLKFYLRDEDLVKEIEDHFIPVGDKTFKLFPLEWIEKKCWA